jgi:hypothetical protein
MRRILPFLCLFFVGCNAPVAAFMDTVFPSRAKSNPGVDVTPRPPADPIRTGPPVPPGSIPPPADLGP